jgi:hypothetical protein
MKLAALLLISTTLGADTLGFVEQKFSATSFEKGKWTIRPMLIPDQVNVELREE